MRRNPQRSHQYPHPSSPEALCWLPLEQEAAEPGQSAAAVAASLTDKLGRLESSFMQLTGSLQERVQDSQQQTLEHLLLYEGAVGELQVKQGAGGLMAGPFCATLKQEPGQAQYAGFGFWCTNSGMVNVDACGPSSTLGKHKPTLMPTNNSRGQTRAWPHMEALLQLLGGASTQTGPTLVRAPPKCLDRGE